MTLRPIRLITGHTIAPRPPRRHLTIVHAIQIPARRRPRSIPATHRGQLIVRTIPPAIAKPLRPHALPVRAKRLLRTALWRRTARLVAVIAVATIAILAVAHELLRNARRGAHAPEQPARTIGRPLQPVDAQRVRFVRPVGAIVAAVARVLGRNAGAVVRAHEVAGELTETVQTLHDDAICVARCGHI